MVTPPPAGGGRRAEGEAGGVAGGGQRASERVAMGFSWSEDAPVALYGVQMLFFWANRLRQPV